MSLNVCFCLSPLTSGGRARVGPHLPRDAPQRKVLAVGEEEVVPLVPDAGERARNDLPPLSEFRHSARTEEVADGAPQDHQQGLSLSLSTTLISGKRNNNNNNNLTGGSTRPRLDRMRLEGTRHWRERAGLLASSGAKGRDVSS